jgi:hypothetical protein
MGSMLIAPTKVKNSTMDINGNVKIPYQSDVLASGAPDSEGWVQVSSMNTTINGNLVWSSLFGIPVDGINTGNTTFNMESTYIELTCTNKTLDSLEGPDGPSGPRINVTYVSTSGPYFSAQDPDPLDPWILGYRGVDVMSYNDTDGSAFVSPLFCPDYLSPDFANKTIEAGRLSRI